MRFREDIFGKSDTNFVAGAVIDDLEAGVHLLPPDAHLEWTGSVFRDVADQLAEDELHRIHIALGLDLTAQVEHEDLSCLRRERCVPEIESKPGIIDGQAQSQLRHFGTCLVPRRVGRNPCEPHEPPSVLANPFLPIP